MVFATVFHGSSNEMVPLLTVLKEKQIVDVSPNVDIDRYYLTQLITAIQMHILKSIKPVWA